MSKYFFIPVLFSILFISCSSVQQRQNKQIATLIHTQKVAFDKGRLDIAKQINNQLSVLVPAPKESVIIHEFRMQTWGDGTGILSKKEILTDKIYTVLPENTDIKNIIVNGSPDYKDALTKDKILAKTESDNNKVIQKLDNTTNSIQREKEKIIEKAESGGNIFSRVIGFFKTFFGVGIIGAIIALIACIFFAPQFIPIILSFIGSAFNWGVQLFISCITGIKDFITKLLNKGG